MDTTTRDRPAAKSKLKIIDADTHLTEPHDLWTKRAPAALKDRVPQVKTHDGQRSWVVDGDKLLGLGAHPSSAILKRGGKVRNIFDFRKLQIDDIHPGSFDLQSRLQVMDDVGVWAQIVYPNLLGFGGQKAVQLDPALRLTCVQIFNDAMAEMQQESGGRFYPMALLPWWSVAESVRETERAKAMGLRGVNINSDPHYHRSDGGDGTNVPDLAQAAWDPLWEVCQGLDMPINFHIGGSEQSIDWLGHQGWPSLSDPLKAALGGTMLFFNNGRVVCNVIASGVLDRYPGLKFVSVESGVGWVPFMLESLKYQFDEIAEGIKFELTPREYFTRNFHACFWFEQEDLSHLIRHVGIDNCMFETDFPHPTSLYPFDDIEGRVASLTAEEQAKVLSLNAAKLYDIPI